MTAKAGRKAGTFAKGHDARRNVTKPGPGRTPDEFKALCQSLASRAETIDAVMAILDDPKHPAYLGALKWATEQGYGKPAQTIVGDPERPIRVAGTLRWGAVEIPL